MGSSCAWQAGRHGLRIYQPGQRVDSHELREGLDGAAGVGGTRYARPPTHAQRSPTIGGEVRGERRVVERVLAAPGRVAHHAVAGGAALLPSPAPARAAGVWRRVGRGISIDHRCCEVRSLQEVVVVGEGARLLLLHCHCTGAAPVVRGCPAQTAKVRHAHRASLRRYRKRGGWGGAGGGQGRGQGDLPLRWLSLLATQQGEMQRHTQ